MPVVPFLLADDAPFADPPAPSMTDHCDVAVIGAGLIGASAASHLSASCKVTLIERESQPGYHSSGRSAAVLLPPYGGPLARKLTAASIEFLTTPPQGFSEAPLLSPRGCLLLAGKGEQELLHAWVGESERTQAHAELLDVTRVVEKVPILRAENIEAALFLPHVQDLDAAALLQGFLKALRACGGSLRTNSEVRALNHDGDGWLIQTATGDVRAKTLVNAAGAWADQLAEMAGVKVTGLIPTRRTMIVTSPPASIDVRGWPLVADVAETFYFKPDASRLMISPADRAAVAAHDVQPEDWDAAVAVDRFEAATSMSVSRIEHQWAGLRTFSPDDEPIIGFAADAPDFLWAAAFGGFGVQAAHAAGCLCSALVLGTAIPEELSVQKIDLQALSPARFTQRSQESR